MSILPKYFIVKKLLTYFLKLKAGWIFLLPEDLTRKIPS